jgi:hypothetical protein
LASPGCSGNPFYFCHPELVEGQKQKDCNGKLEKALKNKNKDAETGSA